FLPLAAAGCTNQIGTDDSTGSSDPVTVAVVAQLSGGSKLPFHPVANANPKIVGVSSPNILPPELYEAPVAQGSFAVENPQTVGGATVAYYGYDGDGPLLPAPGDLPSANHLVEASKTEPDKNTYL